MDVLTAIEQRRSTRAFTTQTPPPSLLREVLDTARWAPSGANTQPWHVAVVAGETKRQLCDTLSEAKQSDVPANPDYHYYANPVTEPYRARQKACGMALYTALDISRDDHDSRKAQWIKNYHAFGAPALMLLFVDAALEKGSWIDMGMFIQNIMLAARGYGLETCPQAALAEYPDIVRNTLSIAPEQSLICGIAIGYGDSEQPVNQYRTERESVDTFTSWYR